MAPVELFVPRYAAEPPQEGLPYGRWAERLGAELVDACAALAESQKDLGEPGEIVWYPDRGWHGHTYVPATARDLRRATSCSATYASSRPARTGRNRGS